MPHLLILPQAEHQALGPFIVQIRTWIFRKMYHPFVSLVHEAKFGCELFHKLVATSVTNKQTNCPWFKFPSSEWFGAIWFGL